MHMNSKIRLNRNIKIYYTYIIYPIFFNTNKVPKSYFIYTAHRLLSIFINKVTQCFCILWVFFNLSERIIKILGMNIIEK